MSGFRVLTAETALPEGTVMLVNTDDVAARLDDAVRAAPVLALEFPKWTDGRAYSQAAQLRRLGYAGDIVAIGDVVADIVPLLERCGFDGARLRAGQSVETAWSTLSLSPAHDPGAYQGDVAGRAPRFAHEVA